MGFELSEAHRDQERTPDKEVKSKGGDTEGRRTDREARKLSEERDRCQGPN